MSSTPGSLGWLDLTVPDPDLLLEFYRRVPGWSSKPVAMADTAGSYADHLPLDAAAARWPACAMPAAKISACRRSGWPTSTAPTSIWRSIAYAPGAGSCCTDRAARAPVAWP